MVRAHRHAVVGSCLIATVLAFASCAGDGGTSVHRASLRRGICTLHRTPLQQTTAYRFGDNFEAGIPHLSEAATVLWQRYPNIIPPDHARSRSADYPQAVSTRFCPECQRRFDTEEQKWRSS